jgi:DNA-binding MurR/RpiR family transcriptional regulator
MNNPLDKIQSYYEDLTKTDKEIAIYIINNPRDVATQPLEYLAKTTGSSKSALSRFAQRIGYAGFTEFKYDVARFLVSHNEEKDSQETDPIKRISKTYSDYILRLGESIDPNQIDRIADAFLNCGNVKVLGFNRSANSANQFKQRLTRIGYSNISSESDSGVIGDLLNSGKEDDVFVIFTTTDNTRYFTSNLKDIKNKKYKIICITCNPTLPFKKQCYEYVTIPRISRDSYASFLDDQALFLVFIEILIEAIVRKTNN